MTKLMNVREVAAYLNIKERKVYDLVKQEGIPCSRITGKWLFPQDRIDQWLADSMIAPRNPSPGMVSHSSGEVSPTPDGSRKTAGITPPPVVAGSHDPLLEWALRESACGLALMAGGSLDGLTRLNNGDALICGMHVLDEETGDYNVPILKSSQGSGGGLEELVLIEWAWRHQGLILAPGNPLGIRGLADLTRANPGKGSTAGEAGKARLVLREAQAGTRLLLTHLLSRAGLDPEALRPAERVARTHTDVALAVLEGHADAGIGVEAVARQLRLEFIPLHRERFDLAMRRRDYFEAPAQTLFEFARSEAMHRRAEELGGYDLSGLGRVHYNAS